MKEPISSRFSQADAAAAAIKPIVIIGSINMDLVCRAPQIPKPGQTILGSDFVMFPGGKGANQAVAAAKLAGAKPSAKPVEAGAASPADGGKAGEAPASIPAAATAPLAASGPPVYMIGRIGDDDFGQRLLNGLTQHGVRTEYITITEGVASGCATILVDAAGENSIVVVPGANSQLKPADIDAAERIIAGAACIVLQLEIPLSTVQYAIELARRHNVPAILDPAPAPAEGLPAALLAVDILTPNQSEAEQLVGLPPTHNVKTQKILDPKQVGMELIGRGARQVVLKLGAAGALVVARHSKVDRIATRESGGALNETSVAGWEYRIDRIAPHKITVVDTTAAGDAFTGALAVALAEGRSLLAAARFANAAGAISCQTFGAQPALPGRDAVDLLLDRA